MRTLILIIMSLFCLNSQSNAQQKKDNAEAKILVAYFSCTGNTESVAKSISKATGGTLYRITPKKAYSSADLDWRDKNSRSSIEMNDENSRPELGGEAIDMNDYDTVFIGYPIWWDLCPRPVNTFIEIRRKLHQQQCETTEEAVSRSGLERRPLVQQRKQTG